MTQIFAHAPVLLQEVLDFFDFQAGSVFVDGTLGRCGHAKKILEKMHKDSRLIGIDKDFSAFSSVEMLNDQRVKFYQNSFANLPDILRQEDLNGMDGILLDLGVSSPQIDDPSRGFSFRFDGPLDMRMNSDQDLCAKRWLNQADETEIANVLYFYGEEKRGRQIAREICLRRKQAPLESTKQLVDIVKKYVHAKKGSHHPATRTFQAIRIFINNELKDLETFMSHLPYICRPNARIAIISFHSLEDRIVKQNLHALAHPERYIPKDLILPQEQIPKPLIKLLKTYRACANEVSENVRSRSAVMRTAQFIS